MTKKRTSTQANGTDCNSSFNQERKMIVIFATPTEMVQYKRTSQFAFTKIDTQRQLLKNSKAALASGVNHRVDGSSPRNLRTRWRTTSTRNITGMPTLKAMTKHALNQSFVTTEIMVLIICDCFSAELISLAPTSTYIQMKSAARAAPQKANNVPVSRIEAPDTDEATHMQRKSTATMRRNCFIAFSARDVSFALDMMLLMVQKTLSTKFVMTATKGEIQRRNQMRLTSPHFSARSLFSKIVNV
mmetsp:Transcript_67157/g.194170  ORF Transcript_67157/g.194170 Transcript_67157/m.194170 type:complete len:244 (-) Transcript_67157:1217-1948(-)